MMWTYLGDLTISIFGDGTGFEMGIEAGKLLREMCRELQGKKGKRYVFYSAVSFTFSHLMVRTPRGVLNMV